MRLIFWGRDSRGLYSKTDGWHARKPAADKILRRLLPVCSAVFWPGIQDFSPDYLKFRADVQRTKG